VINSCRSWKSKLSSGENLKHIESKKGHFASPCFVIIIYYFCISFSYHYNNNNNYYYYNDKKRKYNSTTWNAKHYSSDSTKHTTVKPRLYLDSWALGGPVRNKSPNNKNIIMNINETRTTLNNLQKRNILITQE